MQLRKKEFIFRSSYSWVHNIYTWVHHKLAAANCMYAPYLCVCKECWYEKQPVVNVKAANWMVILDTLLGLCICKFDSERVSASPVTNLTARHWATLKRHQSKNPNVTLALGSITSTNQGKGYIKKMKNGHLLQMSLRWTDRLTRLPRPFPARGQTPSRPPLHRSTRRHFRATRLRGRECPRPRRAGGNTFYEWSNTSRTSE